MDVLSTLAAIIGYLLIFVAVMTGMLGVLVVVISTLPDTNPLKRLLTALAYRVGATVAAGALAIPIEPIPGIDGLYDVAVPVVLLWYWFTFFRDTFMRGELRRAPASTPHRPPANGCDGR